MPEIDPFFEIEFFSLKNMASDDLGIYGWRSTYGKLAMVQTAKFPMVIPIVKHC
jgi:hypothetical protein